MHVVPCKVEEQPKKSEPATPITRTRTFSSEKKLPKFSFALWQEFKVTSRGYSLVTRLRTSACRRTERTPLPPQDSTTCSVLGSWEEFKEYLQYKQLEKEL